MGKWVKWAIAVVTMSTSFEGRGLLRQRHAAWRERRQLLRQWRKAAPQEQFAIMIQMLDASEHFRRAMRKALRVKGDPRLERNIELASPSDLPVLR
jgi:hypothetical protein